MITVPFQGHYKVLEKWAENIKKTHPDFEITFIITSWKNMQLATSEIEKLQSLGIKVIHLRDNEEIQSSAPMQFTFSRVNKLTDAVIDHCQDSDYIVYDFFSPEGYIAGKQLQIPTICSMPAILDVFNKQNALFQQGIKENNVYFNLLNMKYQLELPNNLEMVSDGFFIPSDFKNIIWTWPGLIKSSAYRMNRKHTDNYVFMRPEKTSQEYKNSLLQKIVDLKKDGKKVIYISFGTVVTKNLWDHESSVKDFIKQIFEVLLKNYANHSTYEFVISTGRPIKEIDVLNKNPSNFHLYESVLQPELLKKCDLFITHGGGNSLNEAIETTTPMICIPFFGDQHASAEYIAKNQLGISFAHEEKKRETAINTQAKLFNRSSFTEKKFTAAIENILHNKQFIKSLKKLQSEPLTTSSQLTNALLNWKTLNWHEGDLLYGCSPDRLKLAELTMQQHYYRIGDKRPFSVLFPNSEKNTILPRIVDQYHDVIKYPKILQKELHSDKPEIYKNMLKEYRDFLLTHSHYLNPLGQLDHSNTHCLKSLWNMCQGGLEFFTTIKHKTIHFVIGMFNDKLSEATVKELQWVKQHWHIDNVRKHIKFYLINHGLIKEVDPIQMKWFTHVRPTPSLIDVAPQNLNHQIWNQFKDELKRKAHEINPHRFFNHLNQNYPNELSEKAKKALQSGEEYIYAMLPQIPLSLQK